MEQKYRYIFYKKHISLFNIEAYVVKVLVGRLFRGRADEEQTVHNSNAYIVFGKEACGFKPVSTEAQFGYYAWRGFR